MAKTKTAAAAAPECQYLCNNGQWQIEVDNAPPGFYCPPTLGGTCIDGNRKSRPAIPIPTPDLAANTAEYIYRKSTKSLHFQEGTCGKGKHFPPEISVKELTKIDPDMAELVKSMQKNKRIASFSIVLKAQKSELA